MGDKILGDDTNAVDECNTNATTGQVEDAFCLPAAGAPVIDPETEKIVIAD